MGEIEDRFWSKVNKTNNIEDCWEWTASGRGNGYGAIKYKGKVIDAHRLSYILHFGDIKDSQIFVCHKCDNRKCVNPNHLFIGSHSDNMKDAYKKGRLNINSMNIGFRFNPGNIPINSLTNREMAQKIYNIIESRRKNNQKLNLKQLAREFNLSYQCIKDISCGKSYKVK